MSAASTPETTGKRGIPGMAVAQRIGRSLMLPIAVLPAAALLLRLGANDMLGGEPGTVGEGRPAGLAQYEALRWLQPVSEVVGAAGGALFDNLPLLFALGVAIGFARKADGSTALAGVVGYLVFNGVTEAMSPYILGEPAEGAEQELINFGVLGGIIMGLTAALLWQRYYRIKLPAYLAFFGGRRFVPIITAVAAIIIAVAMSFVYKPFDWALSNFGEWVTENDVIGGGLYGFVNRLLIPLGLHHILNSFPWFQLGEFQTAGGEIVQGDIQRFLYGDPTAGTFMTGFFPIMMFALPAAALAIWHTARPAQKKIVGGIMLSAAVTSFVTGVTEPLEFSFLFVAYPLYFVHAVLTGTSLALTNALGLRDGFGFSAGFIDWALNYRIAEGPLWLVLIGLGYAVIYYFLFRWIITKWNLRTPGREEDVDEVRASLGEEAAEIVEQEQRAASASGASGSGQSESPGSGERER
ncbi:PTS system N-acetylglucosamine-specific IIC component (Glc family) [Haloactinopolyspora alba]|uniref:PTS system N-acetylglucosamine-specific IIC component (Glc family) n=1 Tax=Haloactinopolyspora alba TaxID=648780 RepID=A0A2P8DYX0_9ACTN|nr:PTS transporter subunit EIIC [Haloactinopolyspora alba]PSL02399.1 PTS system N-acetylglucosamine-specific IIC component (Glc family) [Haloactinopolyspora alba]